MYHHPTFQSIINKTWFKNKSDDGVIHPEFSEGSMLSKVTKALAITVVCTCQALQLWLSFIPFLRVENCLDKWQTGEHVNVPFTAAAYKHKFTAHLKQHITFEDKTKESDIVPHLLKHMLKMARYVLVAQGVFPHPHPHLFKETWKVIDTLEATQAIQITEDDVKAAKKEWETMVFSNDKQNINQ